MIRRTFPVCKRRRGCWLSTSSSSSSSAGSAAAAPPLPESQGRKPELRKGGPTGVLFEDENEDLKALVRGYSAEALARAVRDREETLQICAEWASSGQVGKLKEALMPYRRTLVERRRQNVALRVLDVMGGLRRKQLNLIRSCMQNVPDHLAAIRSQNAAVIVPLCNVEGVASILFERRAAHMRKFPGQVCFPGGKVDDGVDKTMMEASLRELSEEIGIGDEEVEVLGLLKLNYSELAEIVGMSVTPVVGFLGDIDAQRLKPNADEVGECFTVPLSIVLSESKWHTDVGSKEPVFIGGPCVVWGLTAQILRVFVLLLRGSFSNLQLSEEIDFKSLP
jgi:8-oxo-dGTP pyrophosphatase MutT (NUDIX family)